MTSITTLDDLNARHFPCLANYEKCDVFSHKADLRKAAKENCLAKTGQID